MTKRHISAFTYVNSGPCHPLSLTAVLLTVLRSSHTGVTDVLGPQLRQAEVQHTGTLTYSEVWLRE